MTNKTPTLQTFATRLKVVNATSDLHRTSDSLAALENEIKNRLDSLSEMGEMESLRLQMALDRMSKLMSTLSNLMKKAKDTQDSITRNLK